MRCSMSVARNASSSSGGTREVSPTTSAGSSARASGESPSVAVRNPARSRPASRWTALGGPVTFGGPPLTRTTAAMRSPSRSGGAKRPWTRRRVDGSSPSQAVRSLPDLGWTVTRTGVRLVVVVRSGPVARSASASRTTDAGASAAPRTRGRVSRGSPVTVTSAVASAYSRASAGMGPRRTSAPCSPATAPATAPHNSDAAIAPAIRRPRQATARGPSGVGARRRLRRSRATATRVAAVQARATVRGDASRASAAAAQVARAGGTRRRSGGPSWRGCDAPRGDAAAAWTGVRVRGGRSDVMAGPAGAGRRTGARRCRSPRGVHRWSGNLRAGCGSR